MDPTTMLIIADNTYQDNHSAIISNWSVNNSNIGNKYILSVRYRGDSWLVEVPDKVIITEITLQYYIPKDNGQVGAVWLFKTIPDKSILKYVNYDSDLPVYTIDLK